MTDAVSDSIGKAEGVRDEYRLKFYIAGALTGVDDEVKGRYEVASGLIGTLSDQGGADSVSMFGYAPHLHGTDPVAHPDVSPEEVRDIDFLFASVVPDFHINFLHPLAHGIAIEEGWAETAMIPTIYMTPGGARLSRLVKGMNNVAQVIEYNQFDDDGTAQLTGVLGEISSWVAAHPGEDPRMFHWARDAQ